MSSPTLLILKCFLNKFSRPELKYGLYNGNIFLNPRSSLDAVQLNRDCTIWPWKVLPQDPKARRLFVTTGGLKKVQMINAQPGSTLYEYISVVNSCFPEEIVRYYSPGYPETLLDKVEQYSPQMMTVLRENNMNDNEMQTEIINMMEDSGSSEDDEEKNVPPQ